MSSLEKATRKFGKIQIQKLGGFFRILVPYIDKKTYNTEKYGPLFADGETIEEAAENLLEIVAKNKIEKEV